MARIEKVITFFGKPARVACDGNCAKAWGIRNRPRVQLSENEDDCAFLADSELGTAPEDPGTYEGGHAKPVGAALPEDLNKWCVRQCERMAMSEYNEWLAPITLVDFSKRLYNIKR